MQLEDVITEDNIRRMVHAFYGSVRQDEVLGPIFEEALAHDWDGHLPRMVDFWSTVLLGTRSFQSNVLGKHMALPGIEKDHFERWLHLFRETVHGIYAAGPADKIIQIAKRIATSLQLGYSHKNLA